ncbi:hypothetical protein [Nocardioides nanhaiensis]|uniref:Uncharacterized protein n=1 Tax=Nocardioides nanhaiensis TaxID=1476871 RepID=A0ABP8WQ06_9ACTN
MQFTEHEMTAGVQAVARRAYEAMPKMLRRRAGGLEWNGLKRHQRFRYISTAGDLVLPGLAALPERPVVGRRPQFTREELAAAGEAACRARAEARAPGRWERIAARRRRRLAEACADQLAVAVAAMPVRPDPEDPESFVVPDHL